MASQDLLPMAREIAVRHVENKSFVLAGKADGWPIVKCALDGLTAPRAAETDLREALKKAGVFEMLEREQQDILADVQEGRTLNEQGRQRLEQLSHILAALSNTGGGG